MSIAAAAVAARNARSPRMYKKLRPASVARNYTAAALVFSYGVYSGAMKNLHRRAIVMQALLLRRDAPLRICLAGAALKFEVSLVVRNTLRR